MSIVVGIFLLFFPIRLWAKKDTTYKPFTYFRIGVDIAKPLASAFNNAFNAYEIQVDANYRKALNLVTEFGFGNSSITNEFVSYSSSNSFVRFGLDHPFFAKEYKGDLDNAFIGLRYGLGFVRRNQVTYQINDPLWGVSNGLIDAKNFLGHWVELTGGFRIELKKNIFAGWNFRLKSIVNPKKFQTLPPAYMAGYGRGDKNTTIDFNLYLLYGIGKRK